MKLMMITKEQELVEKYTPLVHKIANKYGFYGISTEDLAQQGFIGLLTAVRKYDDTKGASIGTYSKYWIKCEILKHIVSCVGPAKMVTTKKQKKVFFNLKSLQKDVDNLSGDEAREIAESLDTSPELIHEMNSRLTYDPVSYDDMSDVLGTHETPEDIVQKQEIREILPKVLSDMSELHQKVIYHRYVSPERLTLRELGAQYSLSKERIRQIELAALAKLKDYINLPNQED